ncbi:ATP-binding protein [Aetokthonos hydrillicola Thurmond2011]|jgi:cytidylate kinase|uniref:ATP-binding protein n=1 Tax=Aetokthonos hydrillicola Thurmond2011 TaxID=2712845 RepID=A0AAP5IFH3_9CYAN|nr:ATP-binding protein [Aetokthonos hydrillicola]MBO3463099.1 AAA family ATPase [Aetokthonos hydrillicola CCALA 1050]MDR9900299.1 ATP-binding protein [Aetokthonos hydrillicola Thurmond2011]
MFKRATKSQIKIRLALSGASGSGKTFSALSVASHISNKVAVIDTERGSASRYADLFNFDVCELDNHHPAKYIDAIKAAEAAGYEVIIIDSLSHAWYAELELVDQAKNSFTAWKDVRPLERRLLDTIVRCNSHVIATMRSKTEWDTSQKDANGKMKPVKIGTAAIQVSGIEYEFDIAGELSAEHILWISKSRCPELQDTSWLKPGSELAVVLKRWIGTSPVPSTTAANSNPNNERVKQIRTLLGIDGKAVLEWLKTEKVANSPAELETKQVDELVQWMAVQWAAKQGMQHNHAANSFNKHVGAMVQQGYEEIEAIQAWMQHVQQQAEQKVSVSVG